MLAEWRHAYANVALTFGNLGFLLIALKSPTPAGIGIAAGLIGSTSFYAWYVNLRRFRAVADTPTSRIASAPQGYVELVGKGVHPPGNKLVSPLSGLPCLWHRYLVEEKNGNKWRRVESGVSSEPFGLHDGTGMVMVDPDEAEVITSNKQVTIKGHYRQTEWTLIEGETLYVLGEHVTAGGANAELDSARGIADLLTVWKHDKAQLLGRFDLDGDGTINMKEWELARLAARRQVEQEHRQIRLGNGEHWMKKARDRMFLIANRTPEEMAARYRFWAWVHLGLLIAASLTASLLL